MILETGVDHGVFTKIQVAERHPYLPIRSMLKSRMGKMERDKRQLAKPCGEFDNRILE